jgi:hypothetical protein
LDRAGPGRAKRAVGHFGRVVGYTCKLLMKLITGGRTTISGRAALPSSSEAAAGTPTTSTLKRNAFKVGIASQSHKL